MGISSFGDENVDFGVVMSFAQVELEVTPTFAWSEG